MPRKEPRKVRQASEKALATSRAAHINRETETCVLIPRGWLVVVVVPEAYWDEEKVEWERYDGKRKREG